MSDAHSHVVNKGAPDWDRNSSYSFQLIKTRAWSSPLCLLKHFILTPCALKATFKPGRVQGDGGESGADDRHVGVILFPFFWTRNINASEGKEVGGMQLDSPPAMNSLPVTDSSTR